MRRKLSYRKIVLFEVTEVWFVQKLISINIKYELAAWQINFREGNSNKKQTATWFTVYHLFPWGCFLDSYVFH